MLQTFFPNLFFVSSDLEGKDKYSFDEAQVVLVNRGVKYRGRVADESEEAILFTYELIIQAPSFEDAIFIVDLIKCCLTLIKSEQAFETDQLKMNIEISDGRERKTNNSYQKMCKNEWFFGDDSLVSASQIAQLSYKEPTKENAIFKYDLARELVNLNPLSLHPYNDYVPRTFFRSEQVKFAYTIIASYAVIEELQVQIKASEDKPSTINGEWNPLVLDSLQERLVAKGVNGNDKIPWFVRRDMVRPFKVKIQEPRELCEWSDGNQVKDFMMPICDAILELSYIRSKIASHGVHKRIYDLTIYDVENAYSLTRIILLKYFNIQTIKYFFSYEGEIYWEPLDIMYRK